MWASFKDTDMLKWLRTKKHQLGSLIFSNINYFSGSLLINKRDDGLYHATDKEPPYISQFCEITEEKSIDKIDTSKIAFQSHGYLNREQFDFWNRRACGVVCVKMVLDHYFPNSKTTLWGLLNEGIGLGGYILYDKNGKFVDLGWFHKALLMLVKRHGLSGFLSSYLSILNVADYVCKRNLVIASIRVPDRAKLSEKGDFFVKGYSGNVYNHLILITAVEIKNGKPVNFVAHNPTGLVGYDRNSVIDAEVFSQIFNGRAIVIRGLLSK